MRFLKIVLLVKCDQNLVINLFNCYLIDPFLCLFQVGTQAEEEIKAETVRERVAAVAVEPQQFDLRVDVHKTNANATKNVEQDENHRRFSNLSNLAQSLPSTSSSASALGNSKTVDFCRF